MNILVTGGAGFIGSRLVHLLRQGLDEVVVFDRAVDPREDVTDASAVDAALRGCKSVVHLAAEKSVSKSLETPMAFEQVNAQGTLTVLQAAHRAGIQKFVYASSSSVYGGGWRVPVSEGAPVFPRSPYAVSKLAGEGYARVWGELLGLPTVICRLFNVYGPGQSADDPYSAVIPRFIKHALAHEPLPLYGTGQQQRDFTYLDDACQGIIHALDFDLSSPGPIFNIATGITTSLRELGQLIGGLTHQSITFDERPPRLGDVDFSCADISRAQRVLRYEPRTTLVEGLRRVIDAQQATVDAMQGQRIA